MRRDRNLSFVIVAALIISALFAAPIQAQHRFHGRSRVFIGGYFGSPYWGFYDRFWDPFWGPYWGPYYQGYPPPWAYGIRDDRTASIRLDVTPKETQVYVDGYYSGAASDYQGAWKRLRLAPGQHEVVLYLKGYRTVRQEVDLKGRDGIRIRQKMAPLAAGEPSDPPPTPTPAQEAASKANRAAAETPEPGEPISRPLPPREAPSAPLPPAEARGFGAVSIRVQPAGAEVMIDGERWQGPEGAGPLFVQVSEGTHQVEIKKDGYVTFSTQVLVRQGETATLNVSLPEQR